MWLVGCLMAFSNSLTAQCSVTIQGPTQRCGPGKITLTTTVSGGVGPYTYLWSNGSTQPKFGISLTQTTTFTVTVTDANGCVATASQTVTVSPLPGPVTVDVSPPGPYCVGQNLTISANHPNTVGPYTYFWNNNATTQSITYTQQSTFFGVNFSVTVTDANNCKASGGVGIPPASPFGVLIQNDSGFVRCADKTLTLKAVVQQQNWTITGYSWSTGEATQEIIVNQGGTYRVTVTNSLGCTAVGVVGVPAFLPVPEAVAVGPALLCPGKTAGLSVEGGIFQAYKWSNGLPPNQVVTINAPGTYTVTVTGSNSCTKESSVVVPPGQTPALNIVGSPNICSSPAESETLTAVGDNNIVSYQWATGEETPSISVDIPGIYRVTVVNSQGCSATKAFTMASGDVNNLSIAGLPVLCFGDSTELRVVQTFEQYNWSNGGSGQFNTVVGPGLYTVTVTNQNGCTASRSFTVQPKSVNLSLNQPDPICSGDSALLVASGGSIKTYKWFNGSTEPETTVTQAGTYTVTVVDNAGCGAVGSITVGSRFVDPARIQVHPYACDGRLNLRIRPDSLSDFVWNTGDTLPDISVTQSGKYAVRVVSKDGCLSTDTVDVRVPAAPGVSIAQNGAFCETGGNNTVELQATPGFEQYLWSNGDTLNAISVSQSGTYSVQVRDTLGCVGLDTLEIGISVVATPQITVLPYNCDGVRMLESNGGFETYNWSNGADGPNITVNASGTYTLTVGNADGCTKTVEANVDIPATPSVAIQGGAPFCPGSTSLLEATTGFESYAWSNGAVTPGTTISTSGNYEVTATDANGCTAVAQQVVTLLPAANVVIRGATSICTGNVSVLSIQGGPWQSFSWSTGESAPFITVSLQGDYSVTATNGSGCSGVATINLMVGDSLSPQLEVLPYACNGKLTLNAGSGYGNYLWSTGSVGSTLLVTQSGRYSVTVSDGSGCSGSAAVDVNVPDLPTLSVSAPAFLCEGSTVDVLAGNGFSSYIWSDGVTTPQRTIGTGGEYTVTATDAYGCSVEETVSIAEVPNPQVQITGPSLVCVGNTVYLVADSPSAFAYDWADSDENGSVLPVTGQGNYSVTVSDVTGCSATASFPVSESQVNEPTIDQQGLCNNVVLVTVEGVYSAYAWSSGGNDSSIELPNGNTYELTLTNAEGCTAVYNVPVNLASTDLESPQIICPADQERCPNDNAVNFEAPTATDNCTVNALEQTTGLPSGSIFPEGVTVNTWVARDGAGNSSSCSFSVQVRPSAAVELVSLTNDVGSSQSGAIDVSVNGPNGPYVFEWSVNNVVVGNSEDLSKLGKGTYTLTVRDNAGCVVASAAYQIDNLSSISEPGGLRRILVNPNPTTGLLNIQFAPAPAEAYDVLLYDYAGRLVLQQFGAVGAQLTIDLSALPGGTYNLVYAVGGKAVQAVPVVKAE